jgi:HK97 gp10 family phage protein
MSAIQVKVSGVYQLKQRLSALQTAVRDRGMKKAVRAGAEKIADKARENAKRIDNPATPESIPLNIAVQFAPKMSRANYGVAYRIGVMGGARAEYVKRKLTGKTLPGGETFYWRFLEFGTSKMPARPFLRPAIDRAEVAGEEIATVLEQFLDRTVPSL